MKRHITCLENLIFQLRLFRGLCWPLATSITKGWSSDSVLQLVQVNICQISKNQFPGPIKGAKITLSPKADKKLLGGLQQPLTASNSLQCQLISKILSKMD